MGKVYFWCGACYNRIKVAEKQESLEKASICKGCYEKGWRLRMKVVAILTKPLSPTKEVSC